MKIKTLIILSFLAIVSVKGYCQQKGGPPTQKEVAPPSPTAIKAAEEMLVASGANTNFDKTIEAGISQFTTQMPLDKRDKFKEIMTAFLKKYCGWEVLKNDICILYAREFTEAELKQLAAFYKSPVGVKMMQKQPLLMQAGMGLGQQAVITHQDELKQQIEELMK